MRFVKSSSGPVHFVKVSSALNTSRPSERTNARHHMDHLVPQAVGSANRFFTLLIARFGSVPGDERSFWLPGTSCLAISSRNLSSRERRHRVLVRGGERLPRTASFNLSTETRRVLVPSMLLARRLVCRTAIVEPLDRGETRRQARRGAMQQHVSEDRKSVV